MEKFAFSVETKNHAREIGEKIDFNPFIMSVMEKGDPKLVEKMIDDRQAFLAGETSPKQIVKFLEDGDKKSSKILLNYARAYVEYGKLREECNGEFDKWQATKNEKTPKEK